MDSNGTHLTKANTVRGALSPHCVNARYREQRLPQFQGNCLIEALPPTLTDEELFQAMANAPEFSLEQRSWPCEERIMMLGTLQRFMVPMTMHFRLVRAMDSMMRTGYIGRSPMTQQQIRRSQRLYESQIKGTGTHQGFDVVTSQISTLLMGVSGMGKTTTVKRWFSQFPRVIYHRKHHIYQIPYLHVEMPSDGSSIKGLAYAILNEIDRLIPGANYYKAYVGNARPGADVLMRAVSRVMNLHYVGFLIADEVQNLANSRKGKQTVMTELVSACNDLGVPILFIGTNKAAKVFSMDFRQSRRACGNGIEPWQRLPQGSPSDADNDWQSFLNELWRYQWVQTPVELNAHLQDVMYYCSQGVIDIAIKLFAAAQARAIMDGTEQITPELLLDVYDRELKVLHRMIEALRDDDLESLAQYDDVAPISLTDMLEDMERKYRGKASKAFSIKSSDVTYVPRIVDSLVSAGVNTDQAQHAAQQVAASGRSKHLIHGVTEAMRMVAAPRPVPKKKHTTETDEPLKPDLNDPLDYRHALFNAKETGATVLEEFRNLGLTAPLEEVLALD